jgi:Effector Associated Constant Component 1
MDGELELHVEPTSRRFDALDDRWLAQVREFFLELNRELGGVSRHTEPVEGSKGGIETIILALGSAGALTGAVELFKAWLSRDESRSLKVSFSTGGGLQSVELTGEEVDDDAVEEIMDAVKNRLGPAS